MDSTSNQAPADHTLRTEEEQSQAQTTADTQQEQPGSKGQNKEPNGDPASKNDEKDKKKPKKKRRRWDRLTPLSLDASSSESSEDEAANTSSSSSSDDSSSDDDADCKKPKKGKTQNSLHRDHKNVKKDRKSKKPSKIVDYSSSDTSDGDSSEDEDKHKSSKNHKKKHKKRGKYSGGEDVTDLEDAVGNSEIERIQRLEDQIAAMNGGPGGGLAGRASMGGMGGMGGMSGMSGMGGVGGVGGMGGMGSMGGMSGMGGVSGMGGIGNMGSMGGLPSSRLNNFGNAGNLDAGRNNLHDIIAELNRKYGGREDRDVNKKKKAKRASTLEYKRVDQLWDSSIHNYKLTESAEDQQDEFNQYVFTVRRKFDWENRYKNTVVDIKSKLLREALQEIMKDVKSVSLVEDQPNIDPNLLFLYLEELRIYTKRTLKARKRAHKKRKAKKRFGQMRDHCKVLLSYLDKDYEETKKTLYPMVEAGNITFDLIWALFKPNSIAYTPTYNSIENPRAFRVDYATKEASFMRGEWYSVEGRYLEYDGKQFGLGEFETSIDSFKGPRKITSLTVYPLEFHKEADKLREQLIERGKKFVSMEGMNYQFHKGLAFLKRKKQVAKVNINGRIMIDPALFRRINPNYPISLIKPTDTDENYLLSDDEGSECACSDDEPDKMDIDPDTKWPTEEKQPKEKIKYKVIMDKDDKPRLVKVQVDESGQEIHVENIEELPQASDPDKKREFTEEELLIASPVVFGFAFSEKLWLEFSISGVNEIEWNEGAFDSLVLPANQKSIVRALVESHKFHAAKTIDDVVQGKGKGLVAVLHGPPGTGKTLTGEGIAELLKCPLYMVSAGELGTDPARLENELQKILDIAHSWGAVLLLDEADVFLEKREVHDIHRNALVSIFLRLLEYFQGILFLTTNRVETFDDAFQSRIHVALRYGELGYKAQRTVWKMFLDKVRSMSSQDITNDNSGPKTAIQDGKSTKLNGIEHNAEPEKTTSGVKEKKEEKKAQNTNFTEDDYDYLARRDMNGRQIKNAVSTAQALAVNESQALSMNHIKRVLEVAESFEADLKGGRGYREAMRQYF